MIKRALIACTILLISLSSACVVFKGGAETWFEHIPASVGRYDIQGVSNDMGLVKNHAKETHSGCGLSDDEFIKYARDRIDRSRSFQFMVFIRNKPLVGDTCYRKAFIYYLKKADAVKKEVQ